MNVPNAENKPKSQEETEFTMYGQKVINLSARKLETAEKNLLCKGLKFCPTQTQTDPGDIKREMDQFHDKLRTKQFFEKEDTTKAKARPLNVVLDKISPYGNTVAFLKLRQKSNWKPPAGSPNLETFANVNDLELGKSHFPKIKKQNITKD